MLATLDALTIGLYVQIDDFLPARTGPGHPPKLSDSETITLAVCQMLLGLPNDRQFLALAAYRGRTPFFGPPAVRAGWM